MGLFGFSGSGKKNSQIEIRLKQVESQLIRANTELRKVKITEKMISNMDTKMRGYRSFPDEMYSTGIKQGPNAGATSYSNDIARRHSRIAYRSSPVGESLVNTPLTLTIGYGLSVQAQPIWDLIKEMAGKTDEEKTAWMKITENRYKIWSKRKSISYDEMYNRYELDYITFKQLLIDGEFFLVFRYATNTGVNPMTIQIIRPEDVRPPSGSKIAQGNWEENGIEYDDRGRAVAYHIYNHSTGKTVRVIKRGTRSGRIFVHHEKLGENRRGVGILSNMITELMKLGDYESTRTAGGCSQCIICYMGGDAIWRGWDTDDERRYR
jgi:hypothetical protein